MTGDGTAMLRLADFGADRDRTAPTRRTAPSPSTPSTAWTTRWSPTRRPCGPRTSSCARLSPTLGYYFAYGGTNCKDWPYKNVRTPAPVEYKGSAPIVVVGTTGDPATPVEWASALRKQLGNAVAADLEGRRPHGLRPLQQLHRQRRGRVPDRRQGAGGQHRLLSRRSRSRARLILTRAPGLHYSYLLHDPPGSPEFHAVASLAQLVERLTRNEKVASSILAGSSGRTPYFRCFSGDTGFFAGSAEIAA